MKDKVICKFCDEHFPNLKGLSVHLSKTHKIIPKNYYDSHFKKEKEGRCSICNIDTLFDGLTLGYRKTCSRKCTYLLDSSEKKPRKIPKRSPTHTCHICGKECNGLKGLSAHIKIHDISSKEYYDEYFLENETNKLCVVCKNETNFMGFADGYSSHCSIECCNNSDALKESISRILIKANEKDGDNIKEKRRTTNLERHGVENPSQLESIKRKKEETSLANYSVKYFTQSKEGKENLSDHTTKRLLNGEFEHRTCFITGYFYSDKNQKDLYYRSSYELKAYQILESDKSVGFYKPEPFKIPYIDEEGVVRRYIPDILITYNNSTQRLIEIKPKKLLGDIRNQLKIESAKEYCKSNNLFFEVWTEQELTL